MIRRIGSGATNWLARWGFATLVAAAGAIGAWAGGTADVPVEVPSFALQAASVYRLEVGAVFFAAAYWRSIGKALRREVNCRCR